VNPAGKAYIPPARAGYFSIGIHRSRAALNEEKMQIAIRCDVKAGMREAVEEAREGGSGGDMPRASLMALRSTGMSMGLWM